MTESLSNAPVESWPVENLTPYENNNKKHPPAQIRALAASIADTGIENPILIEDDGTIISGHGRLEAVMSLGWSVVPVRVARGITKEQAMKLRIAANKTSSTDYDIDALSAELAKLQELDVDLGSMGFTDKELSILIEDVGELDLGSMDTDVVASVERHEEVTKETAERVEVSEVPIAKAFGFKTVPNAAQRTITRFLGVIEESHGKTGLEALLAHMEEVVHVA